MSDYRAQVTANGPLHRALDDYCALTVAAGDLVDTAQIIDGVERLLTDALMADELIYRAEARRELRKVVEGVSRG